MCHYTRTLKEKCAYMGYPDLGHHAYVAVSLPIEQFLMFIAQCLDFLIPACFKSSSLCLRGVISRSWRIRGTMSENNRLFPVYLDTVYLEIASDLTG